MRKWIFLLVLPALLVAGCSDDGGDSPSADEDPTAALVAAFEEFSAAEAQTITATLQSTPESLAAASEGSLPPEVAETILGSSLTESGTKAEDAADQSARISLSVPDTEGAEAIVAGTDLYLRADIRGLAGAFGQDPAMIDQFLEGPVAQQAPFLVSAANGEFLKIEGADELTGATGGAQELTRQQEQVLQELTETIKADAEVTSEGEDDVGEHLLVSVPFRTVYQRFIDLAAQLGTGLPPASIPPESEVPDGNLELDVWVSDGSVVQIELDLVRLTEELEGDMPEGVEELAVRMELAEEAEEIAPPDDAVTVTGEEIMGLILGGAFGGDGSSGVSPEAPGAPGGPGAGDIDCSIYEGLPPETFDGAPPDLLKELKQLCPGVIPE